MATLTIRNVDADVVEALKAKAHNRSLEAEIRQILADQARRPTWRGAELRALAEKIAAMTPDVPKPTASNFSARNATGELCRRRQRRDQMVRDRRPS